MSVPLLHGQQCTLRGVVRDATTNEPLPFANVQVAGTSLGATTGAAGEFGLILPAGEHALRCSYVGYNVVAVVVVLPQDAPVNVKLVAIDVLLQDVTVYAHRSDETDAREISSLSLQSERIKSVTSTMPDVLRAIQMLPGVSANNEFSAKYNVRGGNQDENLVLVNDTKAYEPFHLKEASNASVGIFNVDMIRTMDLMTGGFPARYGDRMSSVLNIEYREGSRDRYQGNASVSLTDADGLIEGPLGASGSFIVGLRKSYLEYVIKMLSFKNTINPSFYDAQAVVAWSLSPQSKVLLKVINAGDDYTGGPDMTTYGPYQWFSMDSYGGLVRTNEVSSDSSASRARYSSTMCALQSINVLSSFAILRAEVSLYDQHDDEHSGSLFNYNYAVTGSAPQSFQSWNQRAYDNTLRIRTWEMNAALDVQVSPSYSIKTGSSYQRIRYDQDQTNQYVIEKRTNMTSFPDSALNSRVENGADSINTHIRAQSFKLSGYIEHVLQVADGLLLNVGGRVDYFDFDRQITWSPRLNVSYRTALGITLRGAWGHYFQSPIYSQLAYSTASDSNSRSQRAIQYVLGAEREFSFDDEARHFVKVKVEGYEKTYDHLINAWVTSEGIVQYSRRNDSEGRARGVDLYVMYARPGLYGWVSYGVGLAEQRTANSSPGWFPRYTDQRHTFAFAGDVELGLGWTCGVRFVYGSGYPYTPSVSSYDRAKGMWTWTPGLINSATLPPYERLDVRLTKGFSLFGGTASVFLDVSNLLDWKNVQAYRYQYDSLGNPVAKEVVLWPILPSLGLSVSF